MYPEGDAGAAPAGDYGYGGDIKSKLTRNLEGLIPLILIIIIAVFLAHKFDVINIPFLGGEEPIQMLVIGMPSADMLIMLDQDKDLVSYRVKEASALNVSPEEQLAQYNIVLLDQHLGGTYYEHSVSRQLGEALQNYVRTGGKLITVMDSGIYQSGGITGTEIASDVVGWKATFGDLIPVECDKALNDVPTCTYQNPVTARIFREDFDHRIMEGIEVAPADPRYPPLQVYPFKVKPHGNEIAYIKSVAFPTYFPGIVESRLIIGKSIFFNYDPALTPGVWQNTMEYLR